MYRERSRTFHPISRGQIWCQTFSDIMWLWVKEKLRQWLSVNVFILMAELWALCYTPRPIPSVQKVSVQHFSRIMFRHTVCVQARRIFKGVLRYEWYFWKCLNHLQSHDADSNHISNVIKSILQSRHDYPTIIHFISFRHFKPSKTITSSLKKYALF